MLSAQSILSKIKAVLDELLATAKELEKISKEVIVEEELMPLQEKQEELIRELQNLDDQLHKEYPDSIKKDSKEGIAIHKKLEEFQQVNKHFMTNLEISPGLLKFGKNRKTPS